MGELDDINSLFDSIVLSEDRLVSEGYERGYRAGQKEGSKEGERLGRERGGKIGTEIGFYLGFVEVWREIYREEDVGERRKEKVLLALQKLEKEAITFPRVNSKEELAERLDQVRAKFRLLCSLLKVNSDFSSSSNTW